MDVYARVKRLDGAHAIVALEQEIAGCGQCSEPGGCRSGILGQMFRTTSREFSVPNEIGACSGDRVVVHLALGGLGRCSVAVYLLPVIAAVIGGSLGAAIVGDALSRDGAAILGSLMGLALAGWLIVRRVAPASEGFRPRLVRAGEKAPKCKKGERP